MTTDLTARYAKAEALLTHNLRGLVDSPAARPNWIRDTETFWYRNKTRAGLEIVLVDAEAGTKRPAFDHERMAAAINGVAETKVVATELPFFAIEFRDDAIRVPVGMERIEVSLDTYEATVLGPVRMGETPSPDGRWAVGRRDFNLYLRDVETGEERQLTDDGAEAFTYGAMADACAMKVMQENLGFTMPPMVAWSPDSTRFVTHRLDQRDCELMHLVRSSPLDGGRPKPLSYRYSVVGEDNLSTAEFFVFDAASGEVTQAKHEPILSSFVPTIALGFLWWSQDSSTVYWLSQERGDKTGRLHRLDPTTGEVEVLHEETAETHIMYGAYHHERNIRVLESGEVLWWSERTGWGHLYLYGRDGSVRVLTEGDWLVRKVVAVDEEARRVVFTAAGREPGSDPYIQQLYSVSLDGGSVTIITDDGLDHDPVPSRSGAYFVDVMSKVDVPAISVLRDATGEVVLELETADATRLFEHGYTPPERVAVKGADGVTDVYCAVYKPHDFDPANTYPVLDEIYIGPQVSCSTLRFPLAGGAMVAERSGAIFAALGFVVVAIDGRGTALRGKAFQDHGRVVREADQIDDHVAAIKQLAETRPWMDLDRVGVYGHSGGGFGSTKAILLHPDFYKVAVSSAGDHDDSMYHTWWGEKFFGLKDEFDYETHSNVSLAENLQGKLFLIHGEMDDNVTPHLTMRLVDALIKANKDFDLLIVPNADHYLAVNAEYWLRRRWDYFVRHLMGETPPDYRIAPVPFDAETLAGLMG